MDNTEDIYFWICPKCGANNSHNEKCQCGNEFYTIRDMFPNIRLIEKDITSSK
jgi:hypothetical protein